MSIDFQDIAVTANPEQAEVRDGSRSHAKKFPFRLSAAPEGSVAGIASQL